MRPTLGVADCERKEHETGWFEMPTTTQLTVTRLNVDDTMRWARQPAVWPQASVPRSHAAVTGREAA
jgi:hypothetical protein